MSQKFYRYLGLFSTVHNKCRKRVEDGSQKRYFLCILVMFSTYSVLRRKLFTSFHVYLFRWICLIDKFKIKCSIYKYIYMYT